LEKSPATMEKTLGGRLDAAFSANSKKITAHVSKFLDANSEALFAPHMGLRIAYSSAFEDELFRLSGVTPDEIRKAIKETGLNEDKWHQRNRPVFVLHLMLYRRFLAARDVNMAKRMIMLMAVTMYSGRHKAFFPFANGTAFDNIMAYTSNNLSNKFLLKQKGSLHGALDATVDQAMETYDKMLKSKADEDSFKFTINLLTRVHNLVKGVASKFHENWANKNYLNKETETNPDDGSMRDSVNVSTAVTRLVQTSSLHFRTSAPNPSRLSIIARANQISQGELRAVVDQASRKLEESEIAELVRLILTIFLVDQNGKPEDVCSSSFVVEALKAYTKSHTSEPNVLALKRTLDSIMSKSSDGYTKTTREATKTNFRKALFMYLVTSIQEANCG
jgi:hypothetical protein